MPSRHAVLFGLNYETTLPSQECNVDDSYKHFTVDKKFTFQGLRALKGSVNDVNKIKAMLSDWHFDDIRTFTDELVCPNSNCPRAHLAPTNQTTAAGILQEMNALAMRSVDENLEVAWIHFSGNGISRYDNSYDERDWYDECVVPSDFKTAGHVSDDDIREVLRKFNPDTKVICVFDCGHSGTMGDLKYRFLESGDSVHSTIRTRWSTMMLEHNKDACEAKVVLISGCSDAQVTVEIPNGNREEKDDDNNYSGALTSSLLDAVKSLGSVPESIKIHELVQTIRTTLKEKVYNSQHPELTCSYFIEKEDTLF